jgi:hypothetical protein
MSELAAFEDAVAKALRGETRLADPRLSGHLNTVAKAAIDALADNYPTVERLVGAEWMRACAWTYWREAPPRDPILLTYGETFPDFLAAFPPAQELPYLAAVARLDLIWREAHIAADAAPLSPDLLAALAPADRSAHRLVLAPSTRHVWLDVPAVTIWRHNRGPEVPSADLQLDWTPEGALFTRPFGEVLTVPIGAGAFAFLDAVAAGASLAEADAVTRARDPALDPIALTLDLAATGAFSGLLAA